MSRRNRVDQREANASKRIKLAERLLKRGRTAGAARVIRRLKLEAEKTDDREALYATAELVRDARAGLTEEERHTFDAILAGAEEGPAHHGPLEIGLVLGGALAVAVGVFLPMAEAETFSSIAKNTLIQSGWLGWALLGVSVGTVLELARVLRTKARSAGPVISGLIVIGLTIYAGTSDEVMTLCPIETTVVIPDCEKASPGIGLYVTGIGGVLLVIGGWQMLSIRLPQVTPEKQDEERRETKTCPDCAETVLAEANVCKHCGYRFLPVVQSEHDPSGPVS